MNSYLESRHVHTCAKKPHLPVLNNQLQRLCNLAGELFGLDDTPSLVCTGGIWS